MKVILDPREYSMEEIYEAYEGLCRKTVRAYGWEGASKEDLFQECVLELCRCVRDFDPGLWGAKEVVQGPGGVFGCRGGFSGGLVGSF